MPTLTRDDLKTRLMVGMEIHVELATRSKMWSSAPNPAHPDFYDASPNTLTDPVVLGMPGTLPAPNKAAVEMAMLVGLALNCRLARHTKWDRKSYYYPDLPKNYQISQYDMPVCSEGRLDIPTDPTFAASSDAGTWAVRIIRAHLEEDAGKLLHEAPGGEHIEGSIVDLNRAGTPLLEIVTYPDIDSAEHAVAFGRALRDICRHLGVCEGVMQRGQMRFEPNINVVIDCEDQTCKTPIVEIKNLNSFRALHDAIAYEHQRQVDDWLESGRTMEAGNKSTRGWDDVRGVSVLQREKEEAHDYRYFPDPDLIMLTLDDAWRNRVAERLPELPLAKRQRYVRKLGLAPKDAAALVDAPDLARFFEQVIQNPEASGADQAASAHRPLDEASVPRHDLDPKRAAAMLLNYGARRANERGVAVSGLGVTPMQVRQIARLVQSDRISSSAADQLFGHCCEPAGRDKPVEQLAEAHGLLQVSDTSALEGYVEQVLADPKNEKAIADIKGGKTKAIGALLGQIMKLSRGQANPKLVREMIRQRL